MALLSLFLMLLLAVSSALSARIAGFCAIGGSQYINTRHTLEELANRGHEVDNSRVPLGQATKQLSNVCCLPWARLSVLFLLGLEGAVTYPPSENEKLFARRVNLLVPDNRPDREP